MPNFWVKSYSKIKENPKATLVKNLYHLRKSLPKKMRPLPLEDTIYDFYF